MHTITRSTLAWTFIAMAMAASAAAQQSANPQAPDGKPSATAPNAQGMMTNPGPGGPTQAPSGVPNSTNVNPGEPLRKPGEAATQAAPQPAPSPGGARKQAPPSR